MPVSLKTQIRLLDTNHVSFDLMPGMSCSRAPTHAHSLKCALGASNRIRNGEFDHKNPGQKAKCRTEVPLGAQGHSEHRNVRFTFVLLDRLRTGLVDLMLQC